MRVTYDWTEADWNEAVMLATERQRRRGSVPGMVYALVGIPLIGAVMDGIRSVRGTGKLTGAGMAVPLLLVLLAAVLGTGLLFARVQRRRRVRLRMPMPTGQWEAVLQESGWRFHAKPNEAARVLPGVSAAASEEDVAVTCTEETEPGAATVSVVDRVDPPANAAVPAQPVALEDGVAALGDQSTAATQRAAVAEPVNATPASSPEGTVPPVAEAAPVLEQPVTAVKNEAALLPWKDLTGSRAGDRVIVFLYRDGFNAVPIRCMTPEQASHLHRMVIRKLRPVPPVMPEPR